MTLNLAKLMLDEIRGDKAMLKDVLKRLEATEENLINLIKNDKNRMEGKSHEKDINSRKYYFVSI